MTVKRFQKILFASSTVLSLLCAWLGVVDIGGIYSRSIDATLDLFTRLAPFQTDADGGKKMVFVDIDEASLEAIGQWPWPRVFMAELLNKINKSKPLVIGVDILMAEEDRFTPKNLVALAGLDAEWVKNIPDGDAILGEVLTQMPVVMATHLDSEAATPTPENSVYAPAPVARIGGDATDALIRVEGVLTPIAPLQSAPGAGFVSIALNGDSRIRRVPLVAYVGDELVPSFALEMLRLAQNTRNHIVKIGTDRTEIKTGRAIITAGRHGFFTLHHGIGDRFTRLSAATILNQPSTDWHHIIEDSFIVIGSSAAGLKDIHATALESAVPGALIHLHILDQILGGRMIMHSTILTVLEMAGAVLLAIVLAGVVIKIPMLWGLAGLIILTGTGFWGYFEAFVAYSYLGNVYFTLGMVAVVSLGTIASRAVFEEYRRHKLRHAFNQYLAPEMVRHIDQSGTMPALGGETTEVTVLFMDIRGFTPMSEALADTPETLTLIVNTIMEAATEVILAHGGTLDKYIGDALMAFWNAPMEQADHASRGVAAALALAARLPEINARIAALLDADEGEIAPIKIGVGLASGSAVVGNLGSQFRFNYSCLGDVVNLAARLEPLGKKTGLAISIAESTALAAGTDTLIPIDRIAVRGKTEAVAVYSPISLSEATRQCHDAFIGRYATGRTAESYLQKLGQQADYPPSLIAYYRRSRGGDRGGDLRPSLGGGALP